MSEREIAELTSMRHDHAICYIRGMLKELEIGAPKFGATYQDAQGKNRRCFHLPRRECLILMGGCSVPLRARITDRWQELEEAERLRALPDGQVIGRSRGGRTTKVHMATNGLGLPLAIELTGGEVSDYKGFDLIFDAERPMPKVLIADRGYDADRIREDVEAAGGSAVIPGWQNRTRPVSIDRFAYRLRNRIERTFGRMKNARRMATRYDQTAASYLRFVQVAASRIWTRHFVNAT